MAQEKFGGTGVPALYAISHEDTYERKWWRWPSCQKSEPLHQHLFIMMEQVNGPSVRDLLFKRSLPQEMNAEKIRKYLWQLLNTLEAMHQLEYYHCDITGKL